MSVSRTTQIVGAEAGLEPPFPDLCDGIYLGLCQEESFTQRLSIVTALEERRIGPMFTVNALVS